MNFILDPYILALPDSPVEALRLIEYTENLKLWLTDSQKGAHKLWLSWAIINALLETGLYPTYTSLQNLIGGHQSSLPYDPWTIFRANERSLTEPPLLDDKIKDTDSAYEFEQALVIPTAIEQRLAAPVAQALRKTLILTALASHRKLEDVFSDLVFASVKNGVHESDLRVEFAALLADQDELETIADEWPILTSPSQLDELHDLTLIWQDTEEALRWAYTVLFSVEESRPSYPKVTAHDGFNDSIRRYHCERRPALLSKIYRMIVMGLTGKTPCHSKHHHPLWSSDKTQIVAGSATAWRLWVESSTPGWRIHYWKHSDGSIELVNLVVHDDYSIALPTRRL